MAPHTDTITRLAGWLRDARGGVAFTGAGISTESGLSDFRSPTGLWARHKPVMYDEFLASRDARVRYWRMRVELFEQLRDARPNEGHRAIAAFQRLGHLAAVVTQNIDGLHQDAGSRRVIELHGTARVVACVGCGKEWPPEPIIARVRAGDAAPDCDACGRPLKSRTISFGQAMPQREMEEAARWSMAADLYVAVGSSLVVEPAASLPRLAKQHGATLVIINKSETPLDDVADLVIREPIGETLRDLWRRCEPDTTS
ncbi:MAG: NAD-dependent deacetylase [Phycisphaerae bacterium]